MPKLLFLGMGLGQTKRYIVEALLDEGYQLVALTERLPAWAVSRLLYGESVDLNAATTTEHAIMTGRTHAVDGVLTCDEAYVELAADVARGLGLPGLTQQAATACRDKHAMRRRLAEAGIPSARSIMADSLAQARQAAEMIGYPVVLKPRNLGGSIGVVRAEGPADVERFFAVARSSNMSRVRALPGLLVEDYLDGPEFSVESVTIDGVTSVCGITEKVLGFAPFFEETGHFARPVDPGDLRDAQLADITCSVHEALGIMTGVTHCELRVTADGPHVIEIGGRVAGDRIPVVTKLATGIDLIAAAAAVATGARPSLEPVTKRVAGIRMVYPDHDGVVTRLDVGLLPSGVLEEMGWYATVGESVVLPPRGFLSRLAYLVAVGQTKDEVVRRLDEGEAALAIEIAAAADPRGDPA